MDAHPGPGKPSPADTPYHPPSANGTTDTGRPRPVPVNLDAIPTRLKQADRWVVWRYVEDRDRETGEVSWDKPPVCARNGGLASSTNPRTWATYADAVAAFQRGGLDGLGFVLSSSGGGDERLVGVDLDKCRDPDTGAVEPWAAEIVKQLDSYTEVSPSGKGLRIFVLGCLPPKGRKKGKYENYESGRYVTVTGQHLDGTPATIEHRQAELEAIHGGVFGDLDADRAAAPRAAQTPSDLDDQELIRRASEAKGGERFRRLWEGDRSGYGSASEADLALVNYLAFWCGPDEGRIAGLFAQSGLFRSKWQREDYRARTITKALAGRTEFYKPRGGKPRVNGSANGASQPGRPSRATAASGVANAERDEEKNLIPFTMSEIMAQAAAATDDWPRRVGGALFVHEGGQLSWIDNSAALFGYYGSKAGVVRWHKGLGCHSKEEVYQERRRTGPAYQAVELLPHEPPMPGHYYACATPPPGDGKVLAELLERFQPSTTLDLDLLKALWVTALWGGAGGTRPAFVITSKHGRGAGKSKLVTMLGHTFGGLIDLAADEDVEVIKQRLLSPDGVTKRIALLDNVKSWRFSRAEFEALITAPAISGKRLYVGEAARPNTLLWVITLNGVSLGADMAQRSVIIEIDRPPRSGTWEEDTYGFIDAHREQMIADALAFLRCPRAELAQFSRWASWERDILSRLPEPADAQRLILERQGAADVEQEEHDIIEGFFRDRLQRLGYDTDRERVRVPTAVAARWMNWATNENHRTPTASRMLNAAIDEGKLRYLRRDPCRTFGRCFLWCGPQAEADLSTCNDIEDRIEIHGDPKPVT